MHDQPAGCDTRLALIVEDAECRAANGFSDVCVGEDNVGALAAKLKMNTGAIDGGLPSDHASHWRRASERNLCDVRVADQASAGALTVAGKDVDHAGREANLGGQFSNAQCGERRELGRLHHDAVTCRESWRHLPTDEHDREVPRHDRTNDAQWFTYDVVQEATIYGDYRSKVLVGHAAEVAKLTSGSWHIKAAGIAKRVPGVSGFEKSEFLGIGFNGIGQLQK